MPKEPIRKDKVMDMIRPLWLRRFPKHTTVDASFVTTSSQESEETNELGTSPAAASTSSAELVLSVETLDRLILDETTELVDGDVGCKTFSTSETSRRAHQWPQIREKFQALKGDMMTLTDRSTPRVTAVIDALEDLRLLDCSPSDIKSRWKLIRALIVSLV